MRTKLGIATGIMALGLFGGVIGAAPAVATTDGPAAQSGKFWLFEHDDQNGGQDGVWGTDKDLRNNYWDGTTQIVSNYASSMKNNSDYDVRLYDRPVSCTGDSYIARANSKDDDFSNNKFDNKASCIVFLS